MASSTSEWMNVTQAVDQWTEFQESYVKQFNNFFAATPVGTYAGQSWSDWLSSGILDSIPNYTMLFFTPPEKWGTTESNLTALMKTTYDRLASSQSGAFDAVVEGTGKALEIAQTSQSSPDMIAKLIDNQLRLMESLKTQQENWFSACADFQAGLNTWSHKQFSDVTDNLAKATPRATPNTVAKKQDIPPQAKVTTKPATPVKGKTRATTKAATTTTAKKNTAAKTTVAKTAAKPATQTKVATQTKASAKTEQVKPAEVKATTPSAPVASAPAPKATPTATTAPKPATTKADAAPATKSSAE